MFNFGLLFYIEIFIIIFALVMIIRNKRFYRQTKNHVKLIEEEELRTLVRKKKQVIDTRMKDDMSFSYIRGVRNISAMELLQGNVTLDWKSPIYIVDWTEKSELKAANKFRKRGAQEVYILEGGMSQVKETIGRFEKIDSVKLTQEDLDSL